MDEWDDLLFFEDKYHTTGLEHGRSDKALKEFREGEKVGSVQGKLLGEELGFYSGCACTWAALAKQYPERFPKRALSTLTTLLSLIQAFPLAFPRQHEAKHALQLIRAKYKVLVSILSYHSTRDGIYLHIYICIIQLSYLTYLNFPILCIIHHVNSLLSRTHRHTHIHTHYLCILINRS